MLTAIPTALGYVLGPLTHAINAIPKAVGLPIGVRLGFMSLAVSVVLARALLGRGAALTQGILLAVTGVALHHGEPPFIRAPKDVLLGLGVELVTLSAKEELSAKRVLAASVVGGLLSYTPYLLFLPCQTPYASLAAALALMPSFLMSCVVGGLLASELMERLFKSGAWSKPSS